MVVDYESFRIDKAKPSVYYVPNFISEIEESHILKNVYLVPKPKWTCLSNRRLQDYGGVPHPKGMITEKIPIWLDTYMNKINQLDVFGGATPNHVLINEYLPGQGIMPHTDGPLFYPTVTTINCGSHTVLEFYDQDKHNVCNILLERRSLLILKEDMYINYQHSISERAVDILTESIANLDKCAKTYAIGESLTRETRISVTIRNVPKVAKLKLNL